jgi:hypothetical protein
VTLSARPLVEFAALLGITEVDLAGVERASSLAHTWPVPAARAAQLRAEDVHRLVAHYADAVRIELRTGDLTELVIDQRLTRLST